MYPVRYLTHADLCRAAERTGISVTAMSVLRRVEGRTTGFCRASDHPAMVFHGHRFHALTDGRFAETRPDLSHSDWSEAHYRGGLAEYARLADALALTAPDPTPALEAASWGMFQVPGSAALQAGFASVRALVNAMAMDEAAHLAGHLNLLKNDGLLDALRDTDWQRLASRRRDPGSDQADLVGQFVRTRLSLEEEAASGRLATERGDIAALQAGLNLQFGLGLQVDGWFGPATSGAIRLAQERFGLPTTGHPDAELFIELGVVIAPAEAETEPWHSPS